MRRSWLAWLVPAVMLGGSPAQAARPFPVASAVLGVDSHGLALFDPSTGPVRHPQFRMPQRGAYELFRTSDGVRAIVVFHGGPPGPGPETSTVYAVSLRSGTARSLGVFEGSFNSTAMSPDG